MMSLHVALDDIQLFAGRAGEDEARRIYPQIRTWTQDSESRKAVWHAGQVFHHAKKFETPLQCTMPRSSSGFGEW
jgi:hypothetical protein